MKAQTSNTIRLAGRPIVFSDREIEVATLVARGHTNKEIAQVLFLSPRTVESHIARICAKLGVRGRTAVGVAFVLQRLARQT